MELIGRENEVQRIRNRVEGPGPSLMLVTGPRRAGKTSVLKASLEDADALWYHAAALPDPDHRALLAKRLEGFLDAGEDSERTPEPFSPAGGALEDLTGADWPRLFQTLARKIYTTHRRTVLVLDGWHRLVDARSRIVQHLTEFWLEVRRRGVPLHLLLSSIPGAGVAPFREPENPLSGWLDEEIRLGPLPYRHVTGLLPPERPSRERLATYGIFGGWPDVVETIEVERSIRHNVIESVLRPDAPLRDWGSELLARSIQAPGRYASILRSLSRGAREWGEIREGVPAFGSSGQMAPYIQRLEEMGIIAVERSLDASEGSRSRRYRIVDPFPAFWFRFVLPHLSALETGGAKRVWSDRIQPSLEDHLSLVFPGICRTWVERYGEGTIPARAREAGGLWGRGYDLELAGTLENGAIFYGHALWGDAPPEEEIADEIGRQIDATRYGFGRERRYRLVFTDKEPAPSLRRRAARDDAVLVLTPDILVA